MLNRLGSRGSNPKNGGESENDGFPVAADTGTMLRERREAMGVSLAEVEAATRIRQKYLSALESNDWHLLPGEIVGRGFLRNYAAYLNLDPNETLARRRAVIEPRMAAALSQTSAGALLPPERQVDYRPKEVDLKDESDDEERTPIRRGPILAALLGVLLLFLVIQNIGPILGLASATATRAQEGLAEMMRPASPTATPDLSMAITAAPASAAQSVTPTVEFGAPAAGDTVTSTDPQAGVPAQENAPAPTAAGRALTVSEMMTQQASAPADPPQTAEAPAADASTNTGDTDTGATDTGAPEQEPAQEQAAVEEPSPTPELPTQEPPTPTPTEEPPTATPEPVAPVVQAPVCPDSRSVITSPGNGQVLSGVSTILGTATHEAFQNYKLEYAPGAGASGGFAYFDGGSNPVTGGSLGTLNTASLANGTYTIQLTVVDQTANFPPPCQITVTIQN